MKKKIWLYLSSFLIIFPFFTNIALADMGPKPSVDIDFKGLEGETYYVTLISKEESTGPYSKDKEISDLDMDKINGFNKFKESDDKDGYFFLGYLNLLNGNDNFSWGYYPPRTFKLKLYFPNRNLVLTSHPMKQYAFNSHYTADFSKKNLDNFDKTDNIYMKNGKDINLYKSYSHAKAIISLLMRIIVTISIEILIAYAMFKPNAFQLNVIWLTNIFTQIILNIGLSIVDYKLGGFAFIFFFIVFEILVFIIEAIIYKKKLNSPGIKNKNQSDINTSLYALVANLSSFVLGFGIHKLISYIYILLKGIN